MNILTTLAVILFWGTGLASAKVEAPNYNFSFMTLEDFYPNKQLAALKNKYGAPEAMGERSGVKSWKFQVSHIRYKFPVIVQEKDGVVIDMFARLPSYFLHDVFLQGLVNRHGKQNQFRRMGEEAIYQWNKEEFKAVYSGACTITCFPIFYSVFLSQKNGTQPLIEQMKSANR
jgi:hypothetical protein